MRAADLKNKNIVIWGFGNEGKASAGFIRKFLPAQPLIFVDEAEGPEKPGDLPENSRMVRGAANIASTLDDADIVVKSPGVSLYHPLIKRLAKKGAPVTSLLNLWLAEPRAGKLIGITGTKGKSTTSALLAHTLKGLGKNTALGGNIGVPVSELPADVSYAVIEVSSFQAANLEGVFDAAILTSFFPEHLDWHGTAENYTTDKLRLLTHAKIRIVNQSTLGVVLGHGIAEENLLAFNRPDAMHAKDGKIFDGGQLIGAVENSYLARAHNLSNVCAVLTAIKSFGLDPTAALKATENFKGLPHRQQELGEKKGVLYVNDSIATTPHAAMAALDVYRGRPITLIAGGYDRGVDYASLVARILKDKVHAVICLGASGQRIHDALLQQGGEHIFMAASMKDVIKIAKTETPKGGVVLLSPGAPSFGLFRDFTERGKTFASEAGF
jgi:UDP-N-acetylmuramoyl-L-alanine---L-glutamate ligase